jgi:hypothetical protein
MVNINILLEKVRSTARERAAAVETMLKESGLREQDIAPLVRLQIDQPEPFPNGIPTLAKGVYRRATPMVAARFEYAGRWVEPGREWLGIRDMEKAIKNRRVLSQIESHRRHWAGSAPATFPKERLTLFGIVEGEEENQTYLVWPEDEETESQVWDYSGQHEHRHANLAAYLEWILAAE